MGHHLIDDALEEQYKWEPLPYNEKLLDKLYVKVSYNIIVNTPNDEELGKLVREKYWELQNK
jgi:hypothetical protein